MWFVTDTSITMSFYNLVQSYNTTHNLNLPWYLALMYKELDRMIVTKEFPRILISEARYFQNIIINIDTIVNLLPDDVKSQMNGPDYIQFELDHFHDLLKNHYKMLGTYIPSTTLSSINVLYKSSNVYSRRMQTMCEPLQNTAAADDFIETGLAAINDQHRIEIVIQ